MRASAALAQTGALADEFLERLRVEHGSSALTIAAYRRDLARLGDFLRTRRRTFETARPDDLVAHLEVLRRAGRSPRTLARGLAAIRGLYRFGRSAGLLGNDPAALLDTPRLPRRLPRALSKADATSLVEAPGEGSPRARRDRAILELLYGSGLRASELVGLRPADVDLQAQILICRGKRDRQRLVPIGDAARRALAAYMERRPPGPGPRQGPRGPLRQHAGRRPRPARALADRPRLRARGRGARGISPRAPALVCEPPARGRRRPPLGPGAPRAFRHRHDRDLHAPPDGRRPATLSPVPPASLTMASGGRRGRRRPG